MGIGFTKKNFLRFVGIFAEEKRTPFKNNVPSDMWWRRLKQRHENFSLRTAEATASNKHNAMTKKRMALYFGELKKVFDEHDFHQYPSRIWNMDETGIQMCHKPPKVLASKGAKTVHGKASISRETITVIACGNASGQKIPPHFIIPGKTTKKLYGFDTDVCLKTDSPLHGSKFSVSDSGWTKDGLGQKWFEETFLPNIGSERPQILICDGHSSHNSAELLKVARQNSIILGELPSHTSHWTQPFDRSVFKSLKTSWNENVDNFVKETGVPLTHANFLRIFGKAWASSITASNVASGFIATGIYPFNPNAIPESAYMPAETNTVHSDQSAEVAIAEPNEAVLPEKGAAVVTCEAEGNEFKPQSIQTTSDPVMASVGMDSFSDIDLNVSNASSVYLSIPLSGNEPCLDLPVSQDLFGNLLLGNDVMTDMVDFNVDTSESDTVCNNVSDEKALEVIESAVSPEQLSKFHNAYLGGTAIDDKMFHTWKMYKDKTSKFSTFTTATRLADKMFPVVQNSTPKQQRKRKSDSDYYFVITADEVFNEKLKKKEEKERKVLEKEKRKLEKESKKMLKPIKGPRIPKKATKGPRISKFKSGVEVNTV